MSFYRIGTEQLPESSSVLNFSISSQAVGNWSVGSLSVSSLPAGEAGWQPACRTGGSAVVAKDIVSVIIASMFLK